MASIAQTIRQHAGVGSRTDALYAGLVLLAGVIVFALQAPNTGFYGPNHGWTSAHGLAIMSHAQPQNGFVGYAMQFRGDDGSISYDYFDRYPFFFSAAMGGLLSLSDNLVMQMRIARYAMAAVYAATVFVAGLLAHTLLGDRWRALAAALLAFSGYWLVFYKDMVHYDQPALFGNVLLLYAIARYKLDGRRWFVLIAALIAVSLGRGYSSYMILTLWAVWEIIHAIVTHDEAIRADDDMGVGARFISPLRKAAARHAVMVFAAAVMWGGVFLAYNIGVEAWRRDVPITQTSIVDSALRRLPVFGEKDAGRTVGKNVPPWDEFAAQQFKRLAQWMLPVRTDTANAPVLLFGGVMWLGAALTAWRLRDARRQIAFLTAFWGVVWIAFMINLTHGHEYTAMYGVGLALVFYVGVLALLPRRAWMTAAALVIAFAAFTLSHWQARAAVRDPATNRARFTADYNRIAARMDGDGRNVHINVSDGRCVIDDDFCYVLGFYLDEHYLSPFSVADYVVSRLPTYYAHPLFLPPDDTDGLLLMRDTLTPENGTAFLFDVSTAQRRTVPDDAATIVTFGDALTLQHWALMDSVTVPACGRVHVESWWLAADELPANYSMQLAMVDADGAGVASSNADLSLLPTRVWVPGMYHIDARALMVPCDIAPGEYPLVMSVYDPAAANSSLTVFNAEGAAMGDFLYLTTLFVE